MRLEKSMTKWIKGDMRTSFLVAKGEIASCFQIEFIIVF